MNIFSRSLFTILSLTLIACGSDIPIISDIPIVNDLPGVRGSSSSSEGDSNPAKTQLDAEPRTVDTGDFVTVRVRLTEVTKPFVLKVRHHESLVYVPNSITLFGDGNPGPNIPPATDFGTKTSDRYLVVPFYEVLHFGSRGRGTLTFNFQAAAASREKIAIDPDEFEQTALGTFFDSNNPRFTAVQQVDIRIIDDND